MVTAFMNVCGQGRCSALDKIKTALGNCSLLGIVFALYFFSTGFDFLAIASGISISRIFAMLLIVLCLLNAGKLRFEISATGGALFALMGVGLVPVMLMSSPQTALNPMCSFELGILIAFLALSFQFSDEDVKICGGALVVASLVLCLLMFVSPGNVGTQWVSERVVVSIGGSQQDANEFCGYMIFAISFLTYYAVKRWRLWNFIFVGVILFCILMTGSRGGLIANLAAFFISFGAALKQANKKIVWLAIAAFLVVLVLINIDTVLALLPASVAQRFVGVSLSDGTGLERTQAWENVFDAFVSSDILRQFFGHGYDSTMEVTFNGLVAHNTYIEVLYTFGFIGSLIFFIVVFLSVFRAWRACRYVEVFALIGFCVLLFSLSAYSFKPFWAVVALALMNTDDGSSVESSKAYL